MTRPDADRESPGSRVDFSRSPTDEVDPARATPIVSASPAEDAGPRADPFDGLLSDFKSWKPSRWDRLKQRAREWWCDRFGHDYEGGSGFNGEYTQHWYQCRRCGDGGSD